MSSEKQERSDELPSLPTHVADGHRCRMVQRRPCVQKCVLCHHHSQSVHHHSLRGSGRWCYSRLVRGLRPSSGRHTVHGRYGVHGLLLPLAQSERPGPVPQLCRDTDGYRQWNWCYQWHRVTIPDRHTGAKQYHARVAARILDLVRRHHAHERCLRVHGLRPNPTVERTTPHPA
uniref:Uncharacterized protein n=2 Tax=Cacopsylla melanoneura TaxID=428564 RepID=A0A8D8Q4P1_9HEMI